MTTKAELAPAGLIYMPHGRDAEVASKLMAEAAIAAKVCPDVLSLMASIDDDASFVLVTLEGIRGAHLKPLIERLTAQPPWSDLPIILLTERGGGLERNPEAGRLSEALGNVSFLERPFHPTTLVSVVRAALKSRLRQFEARTRIEDIREGEKSLSTALLAGNLGSWELDLASRTLTTSATCKRIFGRAATAPFTYDDLISTIHPDDRARMAAAVAHTVESGDDYEIEYRLALPSAPMRWAAISARLVRDRLGLPLKMVGVSADVTERKRSEAALREANDLLEQRVAERTAELERAHAERLAEAAQRERAEALLQQAQKMEMIGQLTGGVAHDFNNLLMAVLGNLELLKKITPPNPRAERLLGGAMEGARRGATLTQRLLAFARRQDLEVRPRDIGELVRGMEDLLERSAGSRVRIDYALDPTAPLAAVDANQVELALMNLVVNARDAMPEGGQIRIALDAIEVGEGEEIGVGRYVRLSVADEGTGMDAATLAKATEPFFSTKELGKGTGLGLSMIHGLANQLGGILRLKSEVGVGTSAELLFPVTDETPERIESSAEVAKAGGRSLQILVVDDDTLIAMSTVDMLEDLGHSVVELNSAQAAIDYISTKVHLDVIVTDYAMPHMTGLDLARAARRIRPSLPVLLASGFADLPNGDTVDLPRLAKPYTQAELNEALTTLMSAP